MSELLTSLKLKKNELDLKVSTLTLNISTINTTCSTRMKDILSSKFPRIKDVIITRDSITVQIRSDDERYIHDITVSNQNVLYSNTFTYNPKVQWSSGSITRTAVTFMSYINVVAFIAAEITSTESEFSKLMETVWSSMFNMNNELNGFRNELNRTNRELLWEMERIKKEAFFNDLKAGNFYYKVRSSYGRSIVYDIIKIDKINRKTIAIMMYCSYGDNAILDVFDRRALTVKRIENYKIYDILKEFILFDRKDFINMVMDYKYKIGIEYVAKNSGLGSVNDIKTLCYKLKEYGITNENVPSNDVLSYISKWRYKTLEANRI